MRRISLVMLLALPLLVSSRSSAEDKRPIDKRPAPRPAPAQPKPKPPSESTDPPLVQDPNDCAVVTGSARYIGYGFTHVVELKNGCEKPVDCLVWTDVDPEPRTKLSLRPGEAGEHVTRRGSPAREVSAFKQCSYR